MSDKSQTTAPVVTVYASDSHLSSGRDVSLKAELYAGMRVKLTMTGENYAVSAWISRDAWDDIVREMA